MTEYTSSPTAAMLGMAPLLIGLQATFTSAGFHAALAFIGTHPYPNPFVVPL